jgi:hypothetical protein
VALRFQSADDVDSKVKEEARRASLIGGVLLILYLAGTGIVAFISGESLETYGKDHFSTIGLAFAVWFCVPYYQEFRIRTKEIDGKVSALEETIIARKEREFELLEMLHAIDGKLDDLSDKLQSVSAADHVTYSRAGIRQGLKTVDAKLDPTGAPK